MKKTTIITLIILAGFVNVCSTVLFYQEVGRIAREQLSDRSFSIKAFSLTINNHPTYNGLVEKVTDTIDDLFNPTQACELSKTYKCSKSI